MTAQELIEELATKPAKTKVYIAWDMTLPKDDLSTPTVSEPYGLNINTDEPFVVLSPKN